MKTPLPRISKNHRLIFVALMVALFSANCVNATTYYARANGNWNINTTWSLTSGGGAVAVGVWPIAGDIVYIGEDNTDRTVTIPSGYSAACATLTIGPTGATGDKDMHLTLADNTASLTVSGNVNINRAVSGGGGAKLSSLDVNAGTVTVGGSIALNGTYNQNGKVARIQITTGTLTISGNLTFNTDDAASTNLILMSGGAGTLNLAGAFTLTNSLGTLTAGTTSTFNFNGSAAGQTIPIGVSSVIYNNINTNNTHAGGATPSTTITGTNVTGNLSVQTGTLFNGGFAITLASAKNFSVSGGATFNLTGTSTMVTVSGGGTKTFGATSTVNYAGANQVVTAETYGHLIFSGSGAKTLPASVITVAGNFTLAGTASATALAVINTAGTVTLGSGTTFAAGSFTHTVGGNWTNNGGTFTPDGGTITFNGSGAQVINGTALSQAFNHITINKGANTLSTGGSTTSLSVSNLTETLGNFTAPATLDINGNLTLTAGTFSAGTTTTIAGNWTRASAAAFSPNAGTVTFDGTTVQAINGTATSHTFNNLTINTTGATPSTTLSADLIVNGVLSIGSVSELKMSTYALSGAFTTAGSATSALQTENTSSAPVPSGKTWAFKVAFFVPGQTIVAGTYNGSPGIQLNGGSTCTVAGDIILASNLNLFNTSSLDLNGKILTIKGLINSNGNFNANGGTVIYNEAGPQTLWSTTAVTYYNLTLSGSGAKTFPSGTTTVNSTLSMEGTATVTMTGSLTYGPNATLQYKGSGPQITDGEFPSTFGGTGGVIINNSSGVSLNASKTISNGLALTSGVLATTSSWSLTVSSTSTTAITGASSSKYINGNLSRGIAAGANIYDFPIGTATAYAPVSMAFAAGTLAGTLAGYTTNGDHGNIGTSALNPSRTVNRNWSFSIVSGLGTANYDAIFNWVSGDLDGGFTLATAICGKYTGSTWTYPTVGTLTATSAQITGVSGFSNFQVGNTNGPVTIAPVAYYCDGLLEIPVKVTSFFDVGAISLTLNYDKNVMTFDSYTANPLLINYCQAVETGTNGIVRFSGTPDFPASLSDYGVLITLKFNYLGGYSDLTWDDSDDTWCEYGAGPPDYIPYTDSPTSVFYFNGSVSNASLIADFEADNLYPPKNTDVQLTDLSTGGATSWLWSFDRTGDVLFTDGSSISQNPKVQFTDGGLYTVTLTVYNAHCDKTEVKTGYILAGLPGVWDGPTSTEWGTGTNWDNHVVPTSPIDVLIPERPVLTHFYPHVTGDLTIGTDCKSITLTGTAELTVDGLLTVSPGKKLDVKDNAKVFANGF